MKSEGPLTYKIYALIDPRDIAVRYIGMTQSLFDRYKRHFYCDGSNLVKDAWIRELQASHMLFIMQTLEVVDTLEEAREREIAWIRWYLDSEKKELANIIRPQFGVMPLPTPPPPRARPLIDLIPPDLQDEHLTYQTQYRKCGKASCGTCRDGQGHGPYWYAYWREGGRLRSRYIGKCQARATSENEA